MKTLIQFLRSPKKGLSLIEVAIAVVIIGISIISLVALQGTLSRSIFGVHAVVERIPLIKNFFVDAAKNKLYTKPGIQEKKIDDPETLLRYSATPPKDTKKFMSYKNLLIEHVEADWRGFGGRRQESFIMFRFHPKGAEK